MGFDSGIHIMYDRKEYFLYMQYNSGRRKILLTFRNRLNLVQEHIQAQYYFYVGILKAYKR